MSIAHGCSVSECKRERRAKGFCSKHYTATFRSTEHRSWESARARCYNRNHNSYKYYGGRGITVCVEWQKDFKTFLKDMGKKPSPAHSLDRIDSSGNYEPSNCRWATRHEQQANMRSNNKVVGVHFSNTYNKWVATLAFNGVVVLQKHFMLYEDAVRARKEAEKSYCLNKEKC